MGDRQRAPALSEVLRRLPEVARCLCSCKDGADLAAGYGRLRHLTYPRLCRFRNGDSLGLQSRHDLVTAWIVFFREEYKVDPRARAIVDAGANIGAFTLYASRRAPSSRIIAVEPFASTRTQLYDTVSRNALGARVEVRPWALARLSERRMMDTNAGPSQSRGLLAKGTVSGEPVQAVSLADFLDRERLDHVDLLKLDIEGGEHELLADAEPPLLARIRYLAMEYHPNGSKQVLFETLSRGGLYLVNDRPYGTNSGVAHFARA